MMKKIIFILILATLATLLFVVYYPHKKENIIQAQAEVPKEPVAAVDPTLLQLKGMSLDEKIGQLLIIGFMNKYPDSHIKKMITQYHIGGVNLLGRNVKDEPQVKKLISDLQDISKTPLFIGVDQEGGTVVRFKFLKELQPQLKITSTIEAEKIAFDRAVELRDLGVNMNFSPVVDYVSNNKSYLYKRTFGRNADETGELGSAMVDGYFKGGVIAVVKHFPGYGNVVLNPHTDESVLPIERGEFENNLIPFKKALANKNTQAVMTAHIVIPEIDSKPATLSYKFMTEILRQELGFDGVVITDDIEMVSAGSSVEDIAVKAIQAGGDMIIASSTSAKTIAIFNRLKKAVLDKEISEERLNQSVLRILKLKASLVGEPEEGSPITSAGAFLPRFTRTEKPFSPLTQAKQFACFPECLLKSARTYFSKNS